METIVLVMVVPMLAPMTMGMAPSMEIAPPATMPTISEVVVELLCTSDVARTPINSPTSGKEVAVRIFSENSFPNSLKEWPMAPMPTMKR